MTGYGKSTALLPGKKIIAEVKSLNSKQFDLSLKLPPLMRELEPILRKTLARQLERGKVEATLYCELTGVESTPRINTTLVKSYLQQLEGIQKEEALSGDLFNAVFRFPEVLQVEMPELNEGEKKAVVEAMEEAAGHLRAFRQMEGAELHDDLQKRLQDLRHSLRQVPAYEAERQQVVEERLRRGLAQYGEQYDQNRFEQELIYYIEKLDINEEKVRLESHLHYLAELLDQGGSVGKKINFISQEIGREINTIGSKANHAELQKVVVAMKDDLEKIKEQALNIL